MSAAQAQLDELRATLLAAGICPDLAKTATNLVFGEGSAEADIVFIGEAPGKNEDLTGKPFVGAAGKFLDEMLEMVGLKRDDVYITNIVKYRPPNNRDPLPEEKKAFLPYLQAQLEVIQPKLVVTLGRHSMSCFLPDLQISQIHGQPKRIRVAFQRAAQTSGGQDASGVQRAGEARTEPYEQCGDGALEPATPQSAAKHGRGTGSARPPAGLVLVILPLFHPAAALYNGGMRQTLIDDFAKIPAVLARAAGVTN